MSTEPAAASPSTASDAARRAALAPGLVLGAAALTTGLLAGVLLRLRRVGDAGPRPRGRPHAGGRDAADQRRRREPGVLEPGFRAVLNRLGLCRLPGRSLIVRFGT